jgi:predicted histidine transporter YuiF (NhaC family)
MHQDTASEVVPVHVQNVPAVGIMIPPLIIMMDSDSEAIDIRINLNSLDVYDIGLSGQKRT